MHHSDQPMSQELMETFFPSGNRKGRPDDLREAAMMRAPTDLQLGATGRFPEGKLSMTDEGEICFAVGHDRKRGKIVLDFGRKPIAWVGMNAKQAMDLAQSLLQHAKECGLPGDRPPAVCSSDEHSATKRND